MPNQEGCSPEPELAGRAARGVPRAMARRAGAWLAWWVVLMAFWVIVDDSIGLDELLAGAGAAALGAFLVEAATHQAADRYRLRIAWLVPAVRLPGRLIGDTVTVFAALYRRLARGEEPRSGFLAEPVRYGPQTAEGGFDADV